MATFGERLSKLRTERTLSLAALATKLGIERSELLEYKQDKSKPGDELLQKMADFFGMNMNYMLKGYWSDVDSLADRKDSLFIRGVGSIDELSEDEKDKIRESIEYMRRVF